MKYRTFFLTEIHNSMRYSFCMSKQRAITRIFRITSVNV